MNRLKHPERPERLRMQAAGYYDFTLGRNKCSNATCKTNKKYKIMPADNQVY
jgi:hypothetical protein